MILLDTNVLVALVDQRDSKRDIAITDLIRLRQRGLIITWPVLTESLHFLPRRDQREYLRGFIQGAPLRFPDAEWIPDIHDVLQWMIRYADQEPDFVDAFLVTMSSKHQRLKVWTYDSEFKTVWRRPDGSAVPLAVR